MCAVLVGGMDRLKRKYMEEAAACGVSLKVFTGKERSVEKQIGTADALILCTGKVSHSARGEAVKHAEACRIPVYHVQSSGISALRGCFARLPAER